MFVKLDFEYNSLILNIDNISSIHYTKPYDDFKGGYFIVMNNEKQYDISKEQYEQLCRILMKRL